MSNRGHQPRQEMREEKRFGLKREYIQARSIKEKGGKKVMIMRPWTLR